MNMTCRASFTAVLQSWVCCFDGLYPLTSYLHFLQGLVVTSVWVGLFVIALATACSFVDLKELKESLENEDKKNFVNGACIFGGALLVAAICGAAVGWSSIAIAVVAFAGLVIAYYMLDVDSKASDKSSCDLTSTVSCSRAARSKHRYVPCFLILV